MYIIVILFKFVVVIIAASSPEPSIRFWKDPASLHHTERGAAE